MMDLLQDNQVQSDTMKFLQHLASELQEQYGTDAESLRIILPGKRARTFLYREWAAQAGKPVWAPEVLTMEELIFETLGFKEADEITLVLALWEICKTSPDFNVTFDQFSGWAPIILRDFNEVDLFLADPAQIFSNLRDARELQLWTPGDERPLSDFELLYLSFYGQLHEWYRRFRSLLLGKRMAFQGMAFRMLAEDPEKLLNALSQKSTVFAGFNAFTPAEEKIIHTLQQSGHALLRWDADSWYLDDPVQEAGYFIRNWREKHPEADFRWISHDIASKAKQIRVFGVGGNRAQARLAGELLSDTKDASPDTAVVLPDEALLLPLLNAIPPQITKFNVTMGLPLRHTPALSWIQLNLRLFVQKGKTGSSWLRMIHLLPVIRHPWFTLLLGDPAPGHSRTPGSSQMLSQRFIRRSEVISTICETYPSEEDFILNFFSPPANALQFVEKMEDTLRKLLANDLSTRPFDQGALLETLRILNTLKNSLPLSGDEDDGFLMIRYFLSRLLQQASVPFTGEPLEGIQILGLLETRNLDFNHVILLSANERILPAGRKQPSLIPSDIRNFYGLPGVLYQDAIYAYHFYHLLQRATRIDILYNSDMSAEKTGEMSRFIKQLEAEWVPANSSGSYMHTRLADEAALYTGEHSVTIIKAQEIITTLLDKLVHKGLSPSQINRYIRCPLMFYFSFVAGVEEPAGFDETLDAKELGTLVHETLHEIYKPVCLEKGNLLDPPRRLDAPFFTAALASVNTLVETRMKLMLGGDAPVTGKNLILMEVARYMVSNFLKAEAIIAREQNIEVLELEKKLERTIEVQVADRKVMVKLKGFADRIDRLGEMIRIADYKTGKVEEKELKFPDLDAVFTDPKYDKALQLLFYCLLYFGTENPIKPDPGIFTLRSPATYWMSLPAFADLSPEAAGKFLEDFQNRLSALCQEILNPQVPFSPTSETERCKRCAYNMVCMTGGPGNK